MEPKIFLSYAWANSAVADEIDYFFKQRNIYLTRDVRDLDFRSSVSDFMKSIRNHYYVITLISDEYLRSENCMFEGLEILLSHEFESKIIPVLLENATHIFKPYGKAVYYDFWENKAQEAIEYRKKYQTQDAVDLVRKYNSIYNYLDLFISKLTDLNLKTYTDLKHNDFQELFNIIGVADINIENEVGRIIDMVDIAQKKAAMAAFVLKYDKSVNLFFYHGWMMDSMGDYTAAKELYLRSLTKKTTTKIHSRTHEKLAWIYGRISDYTNAIKHYEEAKNEDPSNAQLRVDYGVFLVTRLEQYENAKKQYKEAILIDADNVQAHQALALYYEHVKDFEGAIAENKEFMRIDPKNTEPYTNIGYILMHTSDFKAARIYFEKAIEIDKFSPTPYRQYGELLENEKQYTEAKNLYEKAIGLIPNDPMAYVSLGLLLNSDYYNDKYGAKNNLQRALEINPNEHEAAFFLGAILEKKFYDYNGALKYFQLAILSNPNFPTAHLFLAKILETRFSEYQEARYHYEQAIRLNPRSAEAHYYFSELLLKKFKEKDKAKEHYMTAMALKEGLM